MRWLWPTCYWIALTTATWSEPYSSFKQWAPDPFRHFAWASAVVFGSWRSRSLFGGLQPSAGRNNCWSAISCSSGFPKSPASTCTYSCCLQPGSKGVCWIFWCSSAAEGQFSDSDSYSFQEFAIAYSTWALSNSIRLHYCSLRRSAAVKWQKFWFSSCGRGRQLSPTVSQIKINGFVAICFGKLRGLAVFLPKYCIIKIIGLSLYVGNFFFAK